jgi:GNAT superfamily N-acetyltransferase
MSTTSEQATRVRLGKLPVRHDVRTLQLARYVDTAALPAPPATYDETAHVPEWPMYANDRIGDCTCAAAGHMIEAWTAAASGTAVEVSEAEVLAAFDRVKVVDPATGEEGAVELDVLKDWRKTGVGGHRIGAFAAVPAHDHGLVRTASYLFGGVYIGIALPVTAQRQHVWDWTGSLTGPARPGSWGGHAVDVVRYDADTLTVVTWGSLTEMTWAFWDRYVDECYGLLSDDFLSQGKAPNGFALADLKADLALVTA